MPTTYINKRSNQFSHPWTQEEVDFVTEQIGHMTYEEMGNFISRTPPSIQSKVRFLPIQQKIQKYSINRNFFKKWTEEMAYILGFIAADGNICKSGNSHMLQLASDDKDIIYKIRDAMCSKSPIHQRPRQNGNISFQLRLSDKIIYADLLRRDITPRKSLNLKPQKVPPRYLRHYIRGFFDGDGSVGYTHKSGQRRLVFVLYTASYKMSIFLYKIVKRVCAEFKGNIQKVLTPNRDRFFYAVVLGHRDALLMYKYMYRNAKIFMDRKYNKFLNV